MRHCRRTYFIQSRSGLFKLIRQAVFVGGKRRGVIPRTHAAENVALFASKPQPFFKRHGFIFKRPCRLVEKSPFPMQFANGFCKGGNIGYSLMETAHQFLLGHLTCSKFFKQFFRRRFNCLAVCGCIGSCSLRSNRSASCSSSCLYLTLERCCLSNICNCCRHKSCCNFCHSLVLCFDGSGILSDSSTHGLEHCEQRGELLSWGRK